MSSNSTPTPRSTGEPNGKVPLHQKLRRVDKSAAGKQPTKLGQSIDQQILKLVGSNFNEKTVRGWPNPQSSRIRGQAIRQVRRFCRIDQRQNRKTAVVKKLPCTVRANAASKV